MGWEYGRCGGGVNGSTDLSSDVEWGVGVHCGGNGRRIVLQ